MKIKKEQITEAIKQEALRIKKSKEIYKKAIQLNEELKKINEMHGMGIGLGAGFAGSLSNRAVGGDGNGSQVLGLVTPGMETGRDSKEDLETVGSLKDLFNLDKEMQDVDKKEESSKEELIDSLSKENEELKAKLAKIDQTLNEIKK